MQITNTEIQGTKYVQIYLTEDELQKKETKDLVKKYKQEKYSVAIFVTGKENYPEILEKIITKQVELNRNVVIGDGVFWQYRRLIVVSKYLVNKHKTIFPA